MKSYQRVASRFLKAKYQKGNITIQVSSDYASSYANLGVELIDEEGEIAGYCEARVQNYTLEELRYFVCSDDIKKLSEEYWFEDEMVRYDPYEDERVVHVVEVVNTHLDTPLQGKRCGLQMYIELAKEAFLENGRLPFLFIPNYCHNRSTSEKALRVWSSFAKKYHSEGDVIVIDKTPH